jgi:DNA-binding NtrC family response regulator
MGIQLPGISKEFVGALRSLPFPGNIRELRNILERALIDAKGKNLDVEHMSVSLTAASEKPTASRCDAKTSSVSLKDAEKDHVRRIVAQAGGNIAEASRLLGVSRAKIYRIMG